MDNQIPEEMLAYAMQTIYHYCRKYSGLTREDREDFSQDCLVHLCKVWHKYNPSRGKPKTFIANVLRNALMDCLRKHYKRTSRMDYFNNDIDAIMSPEDYEDQNELIDHYIADPIANKVAKMLHNGDNIYEIARAMNWKVGDANKYKQALCVALKKAIMLATQVNVGDLDTPTPKGNLKNA